jgi:hypothetical protein
MDTSSDNSSNSNTPRSTGHSADFLEISDALKSYWDIFMTLETEMRNIVPRPRSDYSQEEENLFDRYLEEQKFLLNNYSEEEKSGIIEAFRMQAKNQIDFLSKTENQFLTLFQTRFKNLNIVAILLSHSLCEALINSILSIGLTNTNKADLYSILDKVEIKKKWLIGPKAIENSYSFPKSTAMYETLDKLVKKRNSIVHFKPDVYLGNEKILNGNDYEKVDFLEGLKWLRRFFSLPYDLSNFIWNALPNHSFELTFLWNRAPIEDAHEHSMKGVNSNK